jgi:dihydroorotase
MSALWILHAQVIDPASRRNAPGDLFVRDGLIVPALGPAERRRARKIDARGLVACPGLVDIHVHFREPGQTHKETIGSGSRAAAAGGFTTVVCMPNTSPPADNAGTIQFIKDAAARDAVVKVYPTGCITVGMKGQALAPFGSLKRAGIVAITDDGDCVQSNEVMRRAAEYAQMFDLPIMDHCQDQSMTAGAVMNEGVMSTRLGLRGWPNAAEDLIVGRNAILAGCTGAHIHLQHISSEKAVEIIRRAKADGLRLTAEASPHHLALTDASLATYDPNFKMNPPLRTERDRRELLRGVSDGVLGIIATDHAPHTKQAKEAGFRAAPFGVIGMETAAAVIWTYLVLEGILSVAQMVERMSTAPAEAFGLRAGTLRPGRPGDVTLFDPSATWIVNPELFRSRSRNCPFAGRTLQGRVVATVVEGKAHRL